MIIEIEYCSTQTFRHHLRLPFRSPLGSPKKAGPAKKTLIGRVEPETGEIVPTDGRHRKNLQSEASVRPF